MQPLQHWLMAIIRVTPRARPGLTGNFMNARQLQLSSASDLTQHAVQADILDADHQFDAVHGHAGGAMLFFIGSGDALCLAKEEPGRAHGWTRSDLSSTLIGRDFPWGASCKRFCVTQGETGTIDLAMVLSDGSDDHLYLSLGNSDADTGWSDDPSWLACPFNPDFSATPDTLQIASILISDASDRYEIVVDIVANPGDAAPVLRRFYLDLRTPGAPEWIAHAGGAGPLADGHISCLGRAGHPSAAEGLYTLGTFQGKRRLQYAPLHGQDGEPAAPSCRLRLPDERVPDAIAACRNPDNTSDLYVAAGDGLYYFAGGSQHDGPAVELLRSKLFEAIVALRAVLAGDKVVLWALNAHGELFHVSCPHPHAGRAAAWSHPLCVLSGVTAVSPFFDRLHGALVVLARTGDGLLKSVKSPVTGLWNRRSIALPPSSLLQPALSTASYVTCIRINDMTGKPAGHAPVTLSASSVTSVYINGLYRIVGPVPISVLADAAGALTIVEQVDGLAGARFQASAGGSSLSVNPMDDAFAAAARMVDDQGLARAYLALLGQTPLALPARPVAPAAYPHALHGDVGDLFSWLECGGGGMVRIVHDGPTGAWHVVATIGDQLFHGVLDCVEKIVAATLWVIAPVKGGTAPAAGLFPPALSGPDQRPSLH
jgi:hypothetical protein